MLEAGEDFLTIKECVGEDGAQDMMVTMDRSKYVSFFTPAANNSPSLLLLLLLLLLNYCYSYFCC